MNWMQFNNNKKIVRITVLLLYDFLGSNESIKLAYSLFNGFTYLFTFDQFTQLHFWNIPKFYMFHNICCNNKISS